MNVKRVVGTFNSQAGVVTTLRAGSESPQPSMQSRFGIALEEGVVITRGDGYGASMRLKIRMERGKIGAKRAAASACCGLAYRPSPLETMAYDAEEAFARGHPTFDAEKLVRQQIASLTGQV